MGKQFGCKYKRVQNLVWVCTWTHSQIEVATLSRTEKNEEDTKGPSHPAMLVLHGLLKEDSASLRTLVFFCCWKSTPSLLFGYRTLYTFSGRLQNILEGLRARFKDSWPTHFQDPQDTKVPADHNDQKQEMFLLFSGTSNNLLDMTKVKPT